LFYKLQILSDARKGLVEEEQKQFHDLLHFNLNEAPAGMGQAFDQQIRPSFPILPADESSLPTHFGSSDRPFKEFLSSR
jgi:hypothetical protein